MATDEAYRASARSHLKLGTCTEKNVNQLKKLNLALFPVVYSDKFYDDVTSVNAKQTHLAYFNDILVGAVCCRAEPAVAADADGAPDKTSTTTAIGQFNLYIMTIGVLAPYRRLGIASQLLQQVLHNASKQSACAKVYLHVQVNNDEVVLFYQRHGFDKGDVVKDYYKRIEPADAVVLTRRPPFPELETPLPAYA